VIAPRLLYGAAVALGIVGVALRVRLPLRAPEAGPLTVTPPPAVRRSHLAATPEDANAYEPVVATDIFSPTRAPPAVRFSPDQAADRPAPPPVTRPARVEGPGARLVGTTIAPSGATALIVADPNASGAQIYRVGDWVGGGSLVAITDSAVVIARARGRLVLRLPATKTARP
jgi:hypothetical protein